MMADDLAQGPLTDAEIEDAVEAYWDGVLETEERLFDEAGDGVPPDD